MAKTPRNRDRGAKDDYPDREPYDKEPFDNPDEHLEIERRRFEGGQPPTPELYARARAQWNRLPGALARPPMGEGPNDGGDDPPAPPKDEPDGNGGQP